MTRKFLSLALAAILPSFLWADSPAIEHERVLWLQNPATEAVISWTTRELGAKHRVYYDTQPLESTTGAYRFQKESFKDGKFTMVAEDEKYVKPGFFHHVRLTDLEPATVYYFTIASGDQQTREFHFVTAPTEDREFSIVMGGDSRIGGATPTPHNDRRKMNARISALVKANPRIIAFVHGGDYCQTAHWRFFDAWLSDHEITITDQGRVLPIIPARGNHDLFVCFEEAFPRPTGLENYYYSLKLSSQAALTILNTEISLAGDQKNWLDQRLAELRPKNRWLIPVYHRPAYPSVRAMQDGASRRSNWVPLFEKYNVDMVYESHDHSLKRTLPIRDNKPDRENGIVYIGDGGLGVPQRTPDPSRWWFADGGIAQPHHHVHMVDFGKEILRIRAFGMEGQVLDDYRISPK